MSDYYVYSHHRKDTGEMFYIGKGRTIRALSDDCRGQRWREVVADAGGFDAQFVDTGLAEGDAMDLEAMLIMHHGRECEGGPLTNINLGWGPNHPLIGKAGQKVGISGLVRGHLKRRIDDLRKETGRTQAEIVETALKLMIDTIDGAPLKVKLHRIRKRYRISQTNIRREKAKTPPPSKQ